MKLPALGTKSLLGTGFKVLPALFFLAALLILVEESRRISAAHLWARLALIEPRQWISALLATACGYAVLTLYDYLGLRVIGRELPYRAAAKGAFLSFTISHNIGLGWISGSSMRQRVYGPMGVPVADIVRLTVFNSVTFFIGAFVLLGAVLVSEPEVVLPLLPLPLSIVQLAGIGSWALVLLYLLLCASRRRPVGWRNVHLPVPRPATAVAQMLLSTVDIGLAALTLYLLLPGELGISFPWLLGVYMIALSASVLTHIPGGLGILETLILWSFPDVPRTPLLAGLIAFRLTYYLVPLAAALLLISGRRAVQALRPARQLVPIAAAGLSLAFGTLLLFSGAMPTIDARLNFLRSFVPLSVLELSHLAGSVVGLGLVVLARALYRRYDGARQLAAALLFAGALATFLKGSATTQSVALAAAGIVLELSSPAFFRQASSWRNAMSPRWLVFSLLVVALSIVAGLKTYASVAYRNELWWQFAYHADAPRFLRASLLVSVIGIALLLAHLLGPPRQRPRADVPTPGIRAAVAESPDTSANLALLGDKRFLTAESGKSFLMYQVEGRSWVALGDPIGERRDWPELVWRFREMADLAGGRPVFYEAAGHSLDIYADAGLVAHKIGEEARVDLQQFSLEGPDAKSFRAVLRRGEREGLSLELVPAADVAALLPELRPVSDAWLAKHGAEKGFSLGAFDPAYLRQFDCAIVRHRHRVVAFANLWFGAGRNEMSMDLMRYRPDAPRGTMMFLMLKLMLWARQSGYHEFNLGMAPLAGLSLHRLAPRWHVIGHLIFKHGERLYGFGGLRQFKAQFHPLWQPRYVVCRPGIVTLALALADCVRLIGHAPRAAHAGPVAAAASLDHPVIRPRTRRTMKLMTP